MANSWATEQRGDKFETKAKCLILPGYSSSEDIYLENGYEGRAGRKVDITAEKESKS